MLRSAALLLLCLTTATAWAQPELPLAEREGITINIFVNYGSAYRDGAWAPVDVIVQNDQEDISGWVEVTLESQVGTTKSPVCRVPAESPKHSLKRFRLYCMMRDVARLEVRLYNGERPVLDFPAWIGTTPIQQTDFLSLVIDDHPEEYSFLSTALYQGEGNLRFYRETLNESQLNLLADHLACYESFDLIVLGDVDPARVSERHRQLLQEYVQRGGLFAVFTGGHAEKHRGSWLEPLIGASIGPETFINEQDLAARVFAGEASFQQGAAADREGIVASLSPTLSEVRRLGSDPVLATVRPLGGGAVAALAIDTSSALLQDTAGYHALWRDLLDRRTRRAELNHDALVMNGLPQVPQMAGVELFPISSVIIYLLLYFLIAIVANWLFWNYWKRREYAWVCLVFFSLAFTGYAMFFGTQGRASRTELEQFDIIRVPADSQLAEITSYVGVLSEGSDRYRGQLLGEGTLMEDVSVLDNRMMMGGPGMGMGMQNLGQVQPFQFILDETSRFENFYVGASDLRFVRTTTYEPLEGMIEATITHDGSALEGFLVNNTGFQIENAALLFNGALYPFERREGRILLNPTPVGHMSNLAHNWEAQQGDYNNYSFWTTFAQFLISSPEAPYYDPGSGMDAALPPCIIARLGGAPQEVLLLENPTARNLAGRMLIAGVDIQFEEAPDKSDTVFLPVSSAYRGSGQNWATDPARLDSLPVLFNNLTPLYPRAEMQLQVPLPPWLLQGGRFDVYLDVYFSADAGLMEELEDTPQFGGMSDMTGAGGTASVQLLAEFTVVTDAPQVLPPLETGTANFAGRTLQFARFHIVKDYAAARNSKSALRYRLLNTSGADISIALFPIARAERVNQNPEEGATLQWQ